jgi:hypothetical protein
MRPLGLGQISGLLELRAHLEQVRSQIRPGEVDAEVTEDTAAR